MISVTVKTSGATLERLERIARTWPEFVSDTVAPRVIPFVERRVTQTLRKEPGPVHYPIRWTTEKQRRYYFAVVAPRDANGNVIAYKRSGAIAAGWVVVHDRRQKAGLATIRVLNNAPASQYVYGNGKGRHQQGFHADTGWPNFVDVMQDIRRDTQVRVGRIVDQAWRELW